MLILQRGINERVIIDHPDGPITVEVLRVYRGEIRLGFEAPKTVKILREELLLRDEQQVTEGG